MQSLGKLFFLLMRDKTERGRAQLSTWGFQESWDHSVPIYHTNPKPMCRAARAALLPFQVFDKTVAELSVSKKIKFPCTLSQCLCSRFVTQVSWRFALMVVWRFFVIKFLCCGKLLDFQFWVLMHTKIDAWKLDATF